MRRGERSLLDSKVKTGDKKKAAGLFSLPLFCIVWPCSMQKRRNLLHCSSLFLSSPLSSLVVAESERPIMQGEEESLAPSGGGETAGAAASNA